MKSILAAATIVCLFMFYLQAQAFEAGAFGLGVGYYSENIMNRTSQSPTGSTGFLGETSYPFNFKYDYALTTNWFIAPQLSYTLLPRKTAGNTATVTLTQLALLFGQNVAMSTAPVWDWYFGPGLLMRDTKGEGGTVEINNGTGTATMALPGRSTSTKKITTYLGTSIAFGSSRWAFDLILENILSSNKRAESLMLSYSYLLGGKSF